MEGSADRGRKQKESYITITLRDTVMPRDGGDHPQLPGVELPSDASCVCVGVWGVCVQNEH